MQYGPVLEGRVTEAPFPVHAAAGRPGARTMLTGNAPISPPRDTPPGTYG